MYWQRSQSSKIAIMPPKRAASKKRVAAIDVPEDEQAKRSRTEADQSGGAAQVVVDESAPVDQSEDAAENGTEVNVNNNTEHVEPVAVRAVNNNVRSANFTNISCAALENSVYPYNGMTSGCPSAWLKVYERYTTLKGWNVENRTLAMPLYLRGPASAWHDQLPQSIKDNYDILREMLIKRFEPSRSELLAELDALVSRRQAPGEDLDTYMLDINFRCRRLKRTEEQEFEITLQGLLPTIKRQVLLQEARTVEDIRRVGKLCELVPEASAAPQATKDSVLELVATLQEKVISQEETINQMKSDKRSNRQGSSSSDRQSGNSGNSGNFDNECYKCGARKCPGKSRDNKEKCFAFGKTCRKCNKINHFQKMCKTRGATSKATSDSGQSQATQTGGE